ncbi:MAG: hypothetical protein N2515_07580, partial [Deltaproteobacteria bacterium]|nr:hypothetical protein [Deltaproteobacteria bacterium]
MAWQEKPLSSNAFISLEETRGVGLRSIVGVALVSALAMLMLLFAPVADHLSTHALLAERKQNLQLLAKLASKALRSAYAPDWLIDGLEADLLGHAEIKGLEITPFDGIPKRRGEAESGIVVESRLEGGVLRLWAAHPKADGSHPLVGLLLLYAMLSAAIVLWLSYSLLSRLIVRPLEMLVEATAHLGKGKPPAIPPRSAREIASLALAFRAADAELRAERLDREAKMRSLERALQELQEAHEALARAHEELKRTKDSLVRSEKLASIGRLAAGIAHEIGNPLAAIRGLVDLLKSGDLPPEKKEDFLERIARETERIHRTLRSLLDYARGPSLQSTGQPASLYEAARHALGLLSPQKTTRNIRFEQRIPPELPDLAISHDALTQVLLNLLLNAIDAIVEKRQRLGPESPSEETILLEA